MIIITGVVASGRCGRELLHCRDFHSQAVIFVTSVVWYYRQVMIFVMTVIFDVGRISRKNGQAMIVVTAVILLMLNFLIFAASPTHPHDDESILNLHPKSYFINLVEW